jgi:hypothetical protein
MRANTDWFRDARWGVFMHYLADLPSNTGPVEMDPDQWNRLIDDFDVAGLAAQLAEAQAGYLMVTLGQNSGYFLSPNATYDELVGYQPSHLSRRDLVADIVAALTPLGIHVMVYSPAAAPALDKQAIERLKCTPPWDARKLGFHPERYEYVAGVDDRLTEFQRNWEAIIAEWSRRWGAGVRGWWFDGCYCADEMYRHPDAPNFESFAAAAKAGNPDSLVAFNPGVKVPVISHSEFEDYTAGELSTAFPVASDPLYGGQTSRYVAGAQYHLLTYLGGRWGYGEPRFSEEFIIGYTKDITKYEGVISWDVVPTRGGLIDAAHFRQLVALGKATRN